jgi:hypothetical protein
MLGHPAALLALLLSLSIVAALRVDARGALAEHFAALADAEFAASVAIGRALSGQVPQRPAQRGGAGQ